MSGATGPQNRLAREKSPYLLQHAGNPVDWYPWGEEAFEKARAEDKPIFLSIGYSTCHWCHVMERESFEDPEVGRILSEHFVPIKVDREERPDVDTIYMTVCQALTGSGGWPLHAVLTPDRKPFFAGTYFPPDSRYGRPGFKQLLHQILGAWESQRDKVHEAAAQITEAVSSHFTGSPGEDLGEETLRSGFEELASRFDPDHGGFGRAPKFPTPHQLTFLLRYWNRTGDEHALGMVEATLQRMRMGGIYDHVGFGFHRYSTDREWLVPHFEKMLYDQALLLTAYAEAYQATGNPLYAAVAREITAYVVRDLRSSEMAFDSAEDADSEGEEGKFYVWTRGEIESLLDPDEAALYLRAYGIESGGNWVDEAKGERPGTNIPHLVDDPGRVAQGFGLEPRAAAERLEAAREKLFAARGRRVRPHRDDKVLTSWNGLMIGALATAAQALQDPAFAEAAERALSFVTTKLVREDGRLLARYRDGEAAHAAYLDDYAFLLWGVLELYEATFAARHLETAVRLARDMDRLFRDEEGGGYFFTGTDRDEALLARTKEAYDGALPSGNSMAALALLRLARMTGERRYEERAHSIFRAFSGSVRSTPSAHTQLLSALDFSLRPSREIVISSADADAEGAAMAREATRLFLPETVVLWNLPSETETLREFAPLAAGHRLVDGKAAAYVCENFACRAPVTGLEVLARALDASGKRPSAPTRAGSS